MQSTYETLKTVSDNYALGHSVSHLIYISCEQFKSHHYDKHPHTHTHKRTLLKTTHFTTLSLRGW